MTRRYILFAVSLIVAVACATFLDLSSVMAGDTPPEGAASVEASRLKFSHKQHIKDVGVECATCHPAVALSKGLADNLIPTHDQCSSCHEEQVNGDCGYCHKNPDDITARPVVDRALLFSHERHLERKNVECATCHAGIEDAGPGTMVAAPTMATCTTCHNNVTASSTCEKCHTDFVTLLPPDHKRSDFLRSHRDMTRLGALSTDCQMCHTETFCQQCHTGAGLKAFLPKDLRVEPRPKTSTKDSPRRTILQNVHELNYRFTHGIDARSKQAECGSCHVTQTFCVECHDAGGNITQGTFKPKSHMVPGFTTLGRGTGGGVHAEEARRDIESCMSCHDVEGRDPSCLQCHTVSGRFR